MIEFFQSYIYVICMLLHGHPHGPPGHVYYPVPARAEARERTEPAGIPNRVAPVVYNNKKKKYIYIYIPQVSSLDCSKLI